MKIKKRKKKGAYIHPVSSLSTATRPRQIRYGLRVGDDDDDACVFVTFLLPMKDGWAMEYGNGS